MDKKWRSLGRLYKSASLHHSNFYIYLDTNWWTFIKITCCPEVYMIRNVHTSGNLKGFYLIKTSIQENVKFTPNLSLSPLVSIKIHTKQSAVRTFITPTKTIIINPKIEFHCPIMCNNDYTVVYYNHPLPLQKKKHHNEDGTIRSEWQNGIYRK